MIIIVLTQPCVYFQGFNADGENVPLKNTNYTP